MLAYRFEADSIPLNKEIHLLRGESYLKTLYKAAVEQLTLLWVKCSEYSPRTGFKKISHLEKEIVLKKCNL